MRVPNDKSGHARTCVPLDKLHLLWNGAQIPLFPSFLHYSASPPGIGPCFSLLISLPTPLTGALQLNPTQRFAVRCSSILIFIPSLSLSVCVAHSNALASAAFLLPYLHPQSFFLLSLIAHRSCRHLRPPRTSSTTADTHHRVVQSIGFTRGSTPKGIIIAKIGKGKGKKKVPGPRVCVFVCV